MTPPDLSPGIRLLERHAGERIASANGLILAINVLRDSAGQPPLAILNIGPAVDPGPGTSAPDAGIPVILTPDELAALHELLTTARATPDSSPGLDFLLGPVVPDWRSLLDPLQEKIAALANTLPTADRQPDPTPDTP